MVTAPCAAPALQRTWQVGITGGIGSGKSTVAGMLAQCGAVLIDADAISRQLTAAGGAAMPAVQAAFGADMLSRDGSMNRPRMRERVFTDTAARVQLQAILHPLIDAQTQAQALAARQSGARCVLHDVPLLIESGARWRAKLDRVLVVDCLEVTQIERVMVRSGLRADEIERIMNQQATRAQRLACADAVVFNQGLSLSQLRTNVGRLAQDFGL